MRLRSLLRPDFIIYISIIVGGLSGIVSGFTPLINIVLVIIGICGSLYSLAKSNAETRDMKFTLDAQAELLAKQGIGNTYTNAFKNELFQTGSCKTAVPKIKKALELTPNDKETMRWFARTVAISLSSRQWIGGQKHNNLAKDLAFNKQYIARAIKLFPDEYEFHESMGMLLDIEGNHEGAREEFACSGKLRNDPFWHLPMATSWLMSGEANKAVEEMKKVVNLGYKNYAVDFYYGRSLHAAGNYEEAEQYLESARAMRKWRPELLHILMVNYFYQAKFFIAAKYAVLAGITTFLAAKVLVFFYLASALGLFCMACFCKLSKPAKTIEPEFTVSFELIKKGHYHAAERLLRKACDIRPNGSLNWANLALCLERQGKKSEALMACDRAIELEPENEAFRHNRKAFELGPIPGSKVVDL